MPFFTRDAVWTERRAPWQFPRQKRKEEKRTEILLWTRSPATPGKRQIGVKERWSHSRDSGFCGPRCNHLHWRVVPEEHTLRAPGRLVHGHQSCCLGVYSPLPWQCQGETSLVPRQPRQTHLQVSWGGPSWQPQLGPPVPSRPRPLRQSDAAAAAAAADPVR